MGSIVFPTGVLLTHHMRGTAFFLINLVFVCLSRNEQRRRNRLNFSLEIVWLQRSGLDLLEMKRLILMAGLLQSEDKTQYTIITQLK